MTCIPFILQRKGQISDEVAIIPNCTPYARDGAVALVEARAIMAPGRIGTEEAKISLIELEVSAPMKGSPDMGEGEWSHRKLMKDLITA